MSNKVQNGGSSGGGRGGGAVKGEGDGVLDCRGIPKKGFTKANRILEEQKKRLRKDHQ